jgi:hypothetical protein
VFRTWAEVLQPKQTRLMREAKALRAALDEAGVALPDGVS